MREQSSNVQSWAEAFQSAARSERLLFQIIDFFPVPIGVFAPGGAAVFVNRALLENYGIASADLVVGQYNVLEDPVINEDGVLRELIRRGFAGEVVSSGEMSFPNDDAEGRRTVDHTPPEKFFFELALFPIWDEEGKLAYIVLLLNSKRAYQGRSDIKEAQDYLKAHYAEEFDLDKAAGAVYLTRYHFLRMFKKHTGVTPQQYHMDLRLNKVSERLAEEGISVEQAFETCGMEYSSYSLRIFREKFGVSPAEYRKSVGGVRESV